MWKRKKRAPETESKKPDPVGDLLREEYRKKLQREQTDPARGRYEER